MYGTNITQGTNSCLAAYIKLYIMYKTLLNTFTYHKVTSNTKIVL